MTTPAFTPIDHRQTATYPILARALRRDILTAISTGLLTAFFTYLIILPTTPRWAWFLLIPLATFNLIECIQQVPRIKEMRRRMAAVRRLALAGIDSPDTDITLP